MRRSPARLVIALSVAAALAVFVLYTSIAGAGTPQIQPKDLAEHHGAEVLLVGKVVRSAGDAHSTGGLRFQLRDVKGTAKVLVVYHGSVPDLFRSGRDVTVAGRYRGGVFTATPGSLVTKCPSKYTPARSSQT